MNKIPKLRFKEFNDEWVLYKLQDISDVRDGTHDSPKYVNEGYPFITSKNLMENGKIDFTDISYITEEDYININKRSKVDIGDILFGMIGTIGNPVIVEKDGFAIKNVALIKEKEKLINKFLIQVLKSSVIDKQFYRLNTGGTQKFIGLGLIRDLEIRTPNIKEQEKIASFFSLIDKKIELQTEKVEELKNYKKGIMQKIFSQELRFKDDNGNDYPEWEKRKLENFIVEYKEKTTVENQFPVLTSSRSGLMFQTDYFKDRQVTTEDNIGYHIIPRGYITFRSRSDDTTFKFNQNNLIDKGIISYFYPVFYFNESLNDMYALYFMNNYLGCQIRREVVGTSQLVLSLNKLKQLKIPVPCIEEQNKIGKLLDNLENKMLQEQNKLKYFNGYKKGLLQQMFI